MIDIELAVRWLYDNAKNFGYIDEFDDEDGFSDDIGAFSFDSLGLIREFRKAMGEV